MRKIRKDIDKQKILVWILAFLIIFWNIASVLGVIAFFRTNKENRSIVASAAENQSNYLSPSVDERISLPFLDGSIVSTRLNTGGTSSTVVNLAKTQWRIKDQVIKAAAGYGQFDTPVVVSDHVNGGSVLRCSGLNIGYIWTSATTLSTRTNCVSGGGVYGNIVVDSTRYFRLLSFNFEVGSTEDEDNTRLIDWLYENCTLVTAPNSAYVIPSTEVQPWYLLSTFAFKPINSTSTYVYDTYSEESITITTNDALGKYMNLYAYSSLSDLTIQRPRMLVFMYSNTVTDFANSVPLGYDLKIRNISGTTKGFVADIHYFKFDDGALSEVGILSLGFGFFTDAQSFVLPYYHRVLDSSTWTTVPNIGDEYNIGTYSFHSANNVAYFSDTNDEVMYWVDQYNALLRNYNNAYGKGESAGYEKGYDVGYGVGQSAGYSQGLASSNQYSFDALLSAVFDVPLNTFTSLFNFDLLGVNLANFFLSLLTVCVIITVVRLLL